jgi:hypothetical protein
LYDVKSQQWMPVNQDLRAVGYVAWSHDSTSVNFDTTLNKEPGYYRLRVSDMKLEKLVDFRKIRLFPGPFGVWTGQCAAAPAGHQHAGDLCVRFASTMKRKTPIPTSAS